MIDVADRIELRRFVGREHLLWLWFESEIFEGTLETKAHGTFGLWVEGRLVLSDGRESTSIKGTVPGHHREAKEALRRGKLPELAGLHLSFGDHEVTFALKAETFAIGGLAALGEGALAAAPTRRSKRGGDQPGEATAGASGDPHEALYERMHLAREVEQVLEALYADFLALRLGPGFEDAVAPALEAWVRGDAIDAERYRAARAAHLRGETATRPRRRGPGADAGGRRASSTSAR